VRVGGVEGCLGGGPDDFGSQALENIRLFSRHFFREGNDAVIASHGTSQSDTDPSISGGSFDDGISWFEYPSFFSVQYHPLTDSVLNHMLEYLDRSAHVHELALGQNLAGDALIPSHFIDFDHGSVADGVEDVIVNLLGEYSEGFVHVG
jgi:hypothetical protein